MDESEPRALKPYVTISRKGYELFDANLSKLVDDDTREAVLQCLRSTFDFDPFRKQYTPEHGRRQKEALKRAATELNMSVRGYLAARKAGTVQPKRCATAQPPT